MKVAVVACGTRGDVQPMAALTLGLRSAGHEALLFAPPENEDWARSLGCPFRSMGAPVRGNRTLKAGGLGALARFVRQEVASQSRQLSAEVRGFEVMLATGLAFGARGAAERLGIAYRYVSFAPATTLGTTKDGLGFRLAGWIAAKVVNAGVLGAVNRSRRELGLPPIHDVLGHSVGRGAITATDAALTIVPPGANLRTVQTGYMHLCQPGPLAAEIEAFLDAGPPPVYVGFGSMPVPHPERISGLLEEAARTTGRRLVVCGGWSALTAAGRRGDCFFVDDVPHALLFPRVAAVVHHGGSGTVATAARAGVPQVVFPHMADQFAWRSQVLKLGLGPNGGLLRMLSARSLSRAVLECLGNGRYRKKAEEVAAAIRATDGVALTVRAVKAIGPDYS
jgi:UDP:flavonoid glycosyltransferase YjiC (YdhE family)